MTRRFSLTRFYRYGIGIVILYCAFFWGLKIVHPGSPDSFLAINDTIQISGQLLMVPFCLISFRRLWRQRHTVPANHKGLLWIPLLLALGLIGESLGEVVFPYYEFVLHSYAPFPSLADVALLSVYLFLLLAILLLPTRPMSAHARLRILLDGLLIMVALVSWSWYFLLGPTLFAGEGSDFAKFVGTTYIVADLVLLLCLLLLALRSIENVLRPVMHILFIALLLIIITDTVYNYQLLHGIFQSGSWLEVSWLAGYMLLGVAALAIQSDTAPLPIPAEQTQTIQDAPSHDIPALWQSLLPYAFVPVVALLALWVWRTGSPHDPFALGVYLGAGVLVALVLIRQILATWETTSAAHRMDRLNIDLQQANALLQQANALLQQANARLEALATTDPLTGLPNHRAFVALLDREINRSERYTRSCALLFFDLDHFKAINDGYGHPIGDLVLQHFAAAVQQLLRGTDTLGRWGGEEFVAVLPETDIEDARFTAERVRSGIAERLFTAGSGLRLTCSIGVASYPTDAVEREVLLAAADRAMYGAKKLGRNQIRLISDPAIQALATEAPGTREDAALAGTVEALAALVEARDHYTGQHTQHVSSLATRLALALGCDASEAYMIGLAGRLHDVGKIAIPDAILRKPGPLTPEEYQLMQTHSVVGSEVVSWVPSLRALAPLIRGHHEHWDGNGYPDHLKGERIPLGARILAVADAYQAIITHRPYKEAREEAEAWAELKRCTGTQFDPAIVTLLEHILTAVGELV